MGPITCMRIVRIYTTKTVNMQYYWGEHEQAHSSEVNKDFGTGGHCNRILMLVSNYSQPLQNATHVFTATGYEIVKNKCRA